MSAATLVLGIALVVSWFARAAEIELSINVAPPPLPVYEQPMIPAPVWIWTPGYWSYGPEGHFWVPGTGVEPPQVGLVWTPGRWGPEVGFYGGVNYGFGCPGHGYEGGYGQGNEFFYNRPSTRIRFGCIAGPSPIRTIATNHDDDGRAQTRTVPCEYSEHDVTLLKGTSSARSSRSSAARYATVWLAGRCATARNAVGAPDPRPMSRSIERGRSHGSRVERAQRRASARLRERRDGPAIAARDSQKIASPLDPK